MEPFEWLAPSSLPDAVAGLSDPDTVAMGGGTSLVLMIKQALVAPARIVWLGHIPELTGIRLMEDGGLWIGAYTMLTELIRSPVIRTHCPMLATAASLVGNPRVRAVATLGGAIAHADPCQDLPPVLLALGALVHVTSPSRSRQIPLNSFFTDYLTTQLEPGEVITGVEIPPPGGERLGHYLKFTPRSLEDFATVGVAAVITRTPTVSHLSIALGGVAATVISLPELAPVENMTPDTVAAIADLAAQTCDPWDDQRGSAAYKRAMARVWTRRVLEEVGT